MNTTSPPEQTEQPVAPVTRRQRPVITEEEDRPFEEEVPSCQGLAQRGDVPTVTRIEEREQRHKHKVEDYKNIVGGIILGVCFMIIVGFALADAFWKIDSDLFAGAFEFAKTIATAVIGYLFASNTIKEQK